MKNLFFATSAFALILLSSAANAAAPAGSHEENATDGKCSVGVLDIGTTKCIVPGPATKEILKTGSGTAGDDARDPNVDNFGGDAMPSKGTVDTGTGTGTLDKKTTP